MTTIKDNVVIVSCCEYLVLRLVLSLCLAWKY